MFLWICFLRFEHPILKKTQFRVCTLVFPSKPSPCFLSVLTLPLCTGWLVSLVPQVKPKPEGFQSLGKPGLKQPAHQMTRPSWKHKRTWKPEWENILISFLVLLLVYELNKYTFVFWEHVRVQGMVELLFLQTSISTISLSFCLSLTPILPCVWKLGWASHWSVARFLVSRVSACFAVSPVSNRWWGERGAPKSLPPLAHGGWFRTGLKLRHVNHYWLYHLHIHLSIRRKWRLRPLRSQLNRSNSHCWMRSRFQCRALCGQATAHCCHIKAVIVTPSVKCYSAPPHIQHSVRPHSRYC